MYFRFFLMSFLCLLIVYPLFCSVTWHDLRTKFCLISLW